LELKLKENILKGNANRMHLKLPSRTFDRRSSWNAFFISQEEEYNGIRKYACEMSTRRFVTIELFFLLVTVG